MLFDPHKIGGDPNAESRIVWSAIQSGTTSVLGLNRNVGSTIITGNDVTGQLKSYEARYTYAGEMVAVRRAASTDPLDLENIVDFYDNTGAIVKTLEIGQSPQDLVTDWTLDLDNNIYTVGDVAINQVVKTDYSTNTKTFIDLEVPVGVASVLDPKYIAYEPTDGLIIVEATRAPDTSDENLYVFSTSGTFAQARRVGDTTASEAFIKGRSSYNVFINWTGSGTQVYVLNGLAPVSGATISIPSGPGAVQAAINEVSDIFLHYGTELYRYDTSGAEQLVEDIGISALQSKMTIDQFNNIFITDFATGAVSAYRQNDFSLKWKKTISDVTATVGDYLPIGYKTNWN